jgi:hypothetical protein
MRYEPETSGIKVSSSILFHAAVKEPSQKRFLHQFLLCTAWLQVAGCFLPASQGKPRLFTEHKYTLLYSQGLSSEP